MNFIVGEFWLTDKSHTEFTPIAKTDKINPVKSVQKINLIKKRPETSIKIRES
jgi:hypothetical protein